MRMRRLSGTHASSASTPPPSPHLLPRQLAPPSLPSRQNNAPLLASPPPPAPPLHTHPLTLPPPPPRTRRHTGSLSRPRNAPNPAQSSLPFKDVTLYQYDVCPFCNKVKAMLDFHGIPYDVVEVNPLFKSEIKFSEYKKVPVVVIDGEQFNDSSVIMRTVDERMAGKAGRGGGLSKAAREKEAKWAAWVDERFVHVVTPNIYRTWGEAWRAFDYITERGNFDVFQRYAVRLSGTVSMYLISQNVLKKRHNIVDERKELYLCMEDWMANAVGKQAFCGGDQPNLADIAVFGVLRAVKTFETFTDACANTSVGPWYKRMEAEVGESTRTDGVQN
mmetsp:Transcript_27554/g.67740  ORF Transcript_27554/g.67740 Transcript_27554/m.67740 type:complete len:332 (-) Transcript_27554:246-1241(-)